MGIWDLRRTWKARGVCTEDDFDLFFTPAGAPAQKPGAAAQALLDQAKEICAMCPVMAECRRDTLGEEYGVWGGLDQYERWRLRRAMQTSVSSWSKKKRLAVGRELHEYRRDGMPWTQIKPATGLQDNTSQELVDEWLEYEKSRPERKRRPRPAKVVIGLKAVPFPAKPGHRHGWVRHNRLVSDAWYKAQTPDGKWLLMNTPSGRGEVQKWFEAKDVHLYSSPPVVIRELRRIRGAEFRIHNPAA